MNRHTTTEGHADTLATPPDEVVLSVRNVSKKFCRNLRRSMAYGIKDLTCNLAGVRQDTTNLRNHEFWALKDVSFELKRGESLGVVGLNGSGKSTLFRVIHGIFPPDAGEIAMRGRIGALIALGAGFHPHMTGRENIFLNGSILGISNEEILERYNEIVEFADIGDFIDAPVSTYSSGMHVRLGFSIAVHMNPEILLIDEVLAVGDISFQNKCFRYLRKLLGADRTIMFVSHNMANVQRICTRAILLDHGEIVEDDSPQKVIRTYSQRNAQVDVDATCVDERNGAVPTPTYESDLAQIIAGHIVDRDGAKQNQVKYRDEVIFSLRVDVYETLEHVIMELLFVPVNMGGIVARTRQFELLEGVRRGSYFATIRCEGMNLAPGVYSVNAVVYDENTVLSMVEDVYRLVIVPGDTGLSSNTAGFFEFDGELRLSKA